MCGHEVEAGGGGPGCEGGCGVKKFDVADEGEESGERGVERKAVGDVGAAETAEEVDACDVDELDVFGEDGDFEVPGGGHGSLWGVLVVV